MADGLDPVTNIYEGIWTNWSGGKIWGLTLTLCPTHAVLLTNALAVLVTSCGIQLFNIIRYMLYQLGASSQPERPTPHLRRQQRVLRSAGTDLATAQGMLRLAWSQRRSSNKRSLRACSIGLFALIYTILFWTAGLFSNKAISTNSANGPWAVLSRSQGCGTWNATYYDIISNADTSTKENFKLLVQFAAKKAHDVQQSLEYAQECYFSNSSSASSSSTCKTFKTTTLGWGHRDGRCPFPAQICHDNSEVIVLYTDKIDSHEHLGINSDPGDRLTYERLTTCAVLNDTKYITGWTGTIANSSSRRPPPDTAYANFGPSLYKDTNWTYSYSNFASFFDRFSSQVTKPYQLDSEIAYAPTNPQYSLSDFNPVAELAPERADLVLLLLSYTGMYIDQIEDPWFSAHKRAAFAIPYTYLQTRYARDMAISTLGCIEQHNFCTGNNLCTGFAGFDQVQNVPGFNAALTPRQSTTFDRLLRAVSLSGLKQISENLALTTTPLTASNATYTGSSGDVLSSGLPQNQWTLELRYWHSIAMAHLQRTVFQWATGQIAAEPQYVQYLMPPRSASDVWFCKNMVVQSSIYQSFNLVAVILIVTLGTLTIIAGLNKEKLATLMSRYFKKSEPSHSWEDEGTSQHVSPLRPRPPRQDLELSNVATIRQSNHRISSPTLPPEDRIISTLDWQLRTNDGNGSGSAQPQRFSRNSGLAISLNNLDFSAPETLTPGPGGSQGSSIARPKLLRPPIAYLPVARQTDQSMATQNPRSDRSPSHCSTSVGTNMVQGRGQPTT